MLHPRQPLVDDELLDVDDELADALLAEALLEDALLADALLDEAVLADALLDEAVLEDRLLDDELLDEAEAPPAVAVDPELAVVEPVTVAPELAGDPPFVVFVAVLAPPAPPSG